MLWAIIFKFTGKQLPHLGWYVKGGLQRKETTPGMVARMLSLLTRPEAMIFIPITRKV